MTATNILEVIKMLAGTVSTMGVALFLLMRIKQLNMLRIKRALPYSFLLAVICGILSMYGTICGVSYDGALINVRDLPVVFAGIVGGPVSGVIAGAIGAVFRMLYSPGATMIPCFIGTMLAGMISSIIGALLRGKRVSCLWGLLIGGAIETLHVLLVAVFGFTDTALAIAPYMIVANAIGVMLFIYFHNTEIGEEKQSQDDKVPDVAEAKSGQS